MRFDSRSFRVHAIGVALLVAIVAGACTCSPKKPVMETLKKEGEACMADDRCETGLCDGTPPVCVRKCSIGCKTEEVCTQLTPGRFSCQPDQRRLCQACQLDSDCPYPADKCIVVNSEKVCGRDCAFDQSCPTGYVCVNGRGSDGMTKVQQCSPMVASCACLARGELLQGCSISNDAGTCMGQKTCDLVNNGITCNAKTPKLEACNGQDDDCDGRIDEDGMMVSCGVGACMRTVNACADGGIALCTPGMPITELCNNVDDDCDGNVDNGFPIDNDRDNCGGCGVRCMLPHATPTCSSRMCQVSSCDPGWENCDTLHPNGCEVETATNAMNCGRCGNSCMRPNSTATCVAGMCQFQCAAGFIDLNMDPMDGCEYACTATSSTDIPDLAFTDANCDGIDGELTNGVFVSPNGLDTAAGTRAAPKRTLTAAVTAATTTGKRDIYIAAGTYAGSLTIAGASGINVAGGYHATTWQRATTNQVIVQGGPKALDLDFANDVLVQSIRFEGGLGTPNAYGAFIKDSMNVQLQALELRAGNGAPGANGAIQMSGTPGSPGGNGGVGCGDNGVPGNSLSCAIWSCSLPSPGSAGAAGCGGTSNNGGQGGSATYGATSGPGTGGQAAPGGAGAGQGVGGQSGSITPSAVANGQNGNDGSGGANGAGGAMGTFSAAGFTPANGQVGVAGTNGRGGGGGGGGCGGIESVSGCISYGSAGGGGGGGACGGPAGQPGLGGGASIGVFLSNSQVAARNVSVTAGTGGRGGSGSAGGGGGMGGSGGTSPYGGNDPLGDGTGQGTACRGGAGGNGGNGGPGGHGGGGSGGPSYGLVRNMNGSSWTSTGSSLITVGTGGIAGTSPANPGQAGPTSTQLLY